MFNSPDGLKFDTNGRLWIQTDGNYFNHKDFEGQGNNQMLATEPATGEIRRFLVGPKECEVPGLTWSPDQQTMFFGIQHPGERGNSHCPEGGNKVPRLAVIAIQREDGGIVAQTTLWLTKSVDPTERPVLLRRTRFFFLQFPVSAYGTQLT